LPHSRGHKDGRDHTLAKLVLALQYAGDTLKKSATVVRIEWGGSPQDRL
jgi:hypothetical protein